MVFISCRMRWIKNQIVSRCSKIDGCDAHVHFQPACPLKVEPKYGILVVLLTQMRKRICGFLFLGQVRVRSVEDERRWPADSWEKPGNACFLRQSMVYLFYCWNRRELRVCIFIFGDQIQSDSSPSSHYPSSIALIWREKNTSTRYALLSTLARWAHNERYLWLQLL